MGLEKTRLTVGIVALCDAAPVIAARERGFFAEQGLDVTLSREPSWANIRDKLAVGLLDGAQMLASMPLSSTLGLDQVRHSLIAVLGLNIGGNAITLGNRLIGRLAEQGAQTVTAPMPATGLKRLIEEDRRHGRDPMTFAMVHPFSTHNYELRGWLAAAGIDPDRDIRLVVVPPSQMVAHLSAGSIDGYCVGEPWNSLAVDLGLGRIALTSRDFWSGRVEKVFAVGQSWANAYPQSLRAMMRALLQAAAWCDQPANHAELAELLARPAYVNAPAPLLRGILGDPEHLIFHRHAANFPWRSQALWYLDQMRRWGQLTRAIDDHQVVDQVYRADLYRLAALELGLPVPLTDSKIEGTHPQNWILTDATQPIAMGPDLFFDRSVFYPAGNRPFQPASRPPLSQGDPA